MKKKNIIKEKSFNFSKEILKLSRKLISMNEFVLSKQILRSSTSVGANIEEALSAHSKKDFLYRMNVAYSESKETAYWLKLLETEFNIPKKLFKDIREINKILAAIVISMKKQLNINLY